MAKTVLCSEEEAAKRVIRHQKTGLTFPATDMRVLNNVLRLIYKSRNQLLLIGRQAQQDAVT